MSYFHSYIYLIIIVKLLFVILAASHIYMKSTGNTDSDLDKKVFYWKQKLEFIFEILMAILLIYLFNPRHDHKSLIDHHIKVLLFVFGFLLLITSKWSTLFAESKWFINLQKIIGKEN